VFSRQYLDFGSQNLIQSFVLKQGASKVLDLGCGYGPIGILLKGTYPQLDLTLVDVNERAVELAKENATSNQILVNATISNGYQNIKDTFDVVLLNPPIRAGKETIYRLYDETYDHLNQGGEFWLVIQKKQGAESTIKKLVSLFGNCEVITKNKGYFILKSKKN
jgi:16S rRNA (guanine1207-N2)-methyltransferase